MAVIPPLPTVVTTAVPWHFGQLHAYESVIAMLLAFGPFLILAVVIVLRRREDDEDDLSAPGK